MDITELTSFLRGIARDISNPEQAETAARLADVLEAKTRAPAIVQHTGSTPLYISLGRGKVKHDGQWHECEIYVSQEGALYARDPQSFFERFRSIQLEASSPEIEAALVARVGPVEGAQDADHYARAAGNYKRGWRDAEGYIKKLIRSLPVQEAANQAQPSKTPAWNGKCLCTTKCLHTAFRLGMCKGLPSVLAKDAGEGGAA